jgi:hypothetical protein
MSLNFISTEDDIYVDTINEVKTVGASLPALCCPGFSFGQNCNNICIWGGLDLATYQTVNDLYYLTKTGRKIETFHVDMFVASNEFTFDLFPTASCALKEQINTPCARSGHSFTKVPDTDTVIMFGGYQLRNRNDIVIIL